jgi:hypothetical protein
MKRYSLLCVAALSIGAAACSGTPGDEVPENGVAMNQTTAEEATGTTDMAEAPAAFPDQIAEDRTAGAPPQDDAALPLTASPLGMAALIGLLSLSGAAGIRFMRR